MPEKNTKNHPVLTDLYTDHDKIYTLNADLDVN